MTIELVVPVLPCATCAHAVVCAVKPTLERQSRDWLLMPNPDPLITVTARLTVECAEYLPLVEVKPHVVLDRLLTGTWPPTAEQPEELEEPEVEQLEEDVNDRLFAAIRSKPALGYSAIGRELGLHNANIHHRLNLLTRAGALPDDIQAWRDAHHLGKGAKPAPIVAPKNRPAAKAKPERVYGGTPAADPAAVLDRVHESLQPAVAEQFKAAAAIDRPWSPDCMSPADFTDWTRHNEKTNGMRAKRPCEDCPLAYALEMRGINSCNGYPAGGWAVASLPVIQ